MTDNITIDKYKYIVWKYINETRDKLYNFKTYLDWDDIEQECMITLYKCIQGYDKTIGSSFLNYAITAIKRCIIRQINIQDKICTHSDIDNFYSLQGDPDINIIDDIDSNIIRDKITRIIDTLSITNKSKEILKHRLSGKTQKEIGELYGMTPQAVGLIIQTHKDKIKNRLTKGGTDAYRI